MGGTMNLVSVHVVRWLYAIIAGYLWPRISPVLGVEKADMLSSKMKA